VNPRMPGASCETRLSEANLRRLRHIVAGHGIQGAAHRLGIAHTTIDRVIDGGVAQTKTIARVVQRIEEWERFHAKVDR
jgi:hypothetical protein